MKWWKRLLNSQLLEDIINNFDPYSIEAQRILVSEKLKHKETQQGEQK